MISIPDRQRLLSESLAGLGDQEGSGAVVDLDVAAGDEEWLT